MMKHLIIGNCIAAAGAVEGIRSVDGSGTITIIDGEKRGSYTRPLITYFLAHPAEVTDLSYRSQEFFADHNVEIIAARAEKINKEEQTVILDNGAGIEYDRLLLATGARPLWPPLPGLEQPWVKSLYTMEDSEQINSAIRSEERAVVMGTGLVGIKAAEALAHRGLQVTMVEKESHLLPRLLTGKMAAVLTEHLAASGIQVMAGEEVTAIAADHQVELKSGLQLAADLVIVAVGTRPNKELAVECEVETRGGIIVNEHMRTSDEHIYAAGDVAETVNLLSGRAELMPLLPHAHREGYLAGKNMAGETCRHPGAIPLNSFKIMDWHVGAAGSSMANATVTTWSNGRQWLELEFAGGLLCKYTAINLPEISGPLTTIIEKKLPIPQLQWQEFMENPGLAAIPEAYWQETRRWPDYGSLKCS